MSETLIREVSDTALWVAAFRAFESRRPDALYQDPLAERLAGARGLEFARKMPFPRVLAWIMAVRTVVIDRLIERAIAKGVDTVVNLGAGMDTRPYRMNLPAGLRWVELDFPSTIAFKNERLKDERPRCELKRIAVDLPRSSCGPCGVRGHRCIHNEQFGPPKRLRKRMANAPFLFSHPEPLALFAQHGWHAKDVVSGIDEGERLGRPFPFTFPFNLFMKFIPKSKLGAFRKSVTYVLLQKEDWT